MKILQRYVIFEVIRAFSLALLTMSAIFVLFMVAAQARDVGLSPQDIVELVPYVLPSTLPYTIPVSLLFAVTVVYGRLAGDNEIIAVKTAGLSVMTILWPTFGLAIGLSLLLLHLSGNWIPQCTHQAKMVLYRDMEDMFYKMLKRDREFNGPGWPFLIKVRDVHGKDMINADLQAQGQGPRPGSGRLRPRDQGQAAVLHFDLNGEDRPGLLRSGRDPALSPRRRRLPDQRSGARDPHPPRQQVQRGEEDPGIHEHGPHATSSATRGELLETERKREAIKTAFAFASGRTDRIDWGDQSRMRSSITVITVGNAISSRPNGGSASRWPAAACCSWSWAPGRDHVRKARLLERLHDLLLADHHLLLPAHAPGRRT